MRCKARVEEAGIGEVESHAPVVRELLQNDFEGGGIKQLQHVERHVHNPAAEQIREKFGNNNA